MFFGWLDVLFVGRITQNYSKTYSNLGRRMGNGPRSSPLNSPTDLVKGADREL